MDFILSNIALASYAKLGGTPWHLRVNNPMAHELVVGLGSTSISDSQAWRTTAHGRDHDDVHERRALLAWQYVERRAL